MNLKSIERRCIGLYGRKTGGELSRAMKKIYHIDFCVATSWSPNEISIAKGCYSRGRVFRLTSDYMSLIMPNGEIREIDSLSYSDISKYLPKSTKILDNEHLHCSLDKK